MFEVIIAQPSITWRVAFGVVVGGALVFCGAAVWLLWTADRSIDRGEAPVDAA